MTDEQQEEWERGYAHGDIPRRAEEGASKTYLEGYWAALRGPEAPRKLTLEERLAEFKGRKSHLRS